MNEIFLVLFGVAVGARYAESIREKVPLLKPDKDESSDIVAS